MHQDKQLCPDEYLSVGEIAERCGVETSALRFYEAQGLIQSIRTAGNQRRFHRSVIRRIAVLQVAKTIGLNLNEIVESFKELPGDSRVPSKKNWETLSKRWRKRLDEKISHFEKIRDELNGCIGCGCLSLKECRLANPNDCLNGQGSGAVKLNPDFKDYIKKY